MNVYKDGDIEIEVATVHSVKGETHAATLFLETKNYKYESEHFGAQLNGEPKYLLAYAIHKERFNKLDRDKLEKIWDVREVV